MSVHNIALPARRTLGETDYDSYVRACRADMPPTDEVATELIGEEAGSITLEMERVMIGDVLDFRLNLPTELDGIPIALKNMRFRHIKAKSIIITVDNQLVESIREHNNLTTAEPISYLFGERYFPTALFKSSSIFVTPKSAPITDGESEQDLLPPRVTFDVLKLTELPAIRAVEVYAKYQETMPARQQDLAGGTQHWFIPSDRLADGMNWPVEEITLDTRGPVDQVALLSMALIVPMKPETEGKAFCLKWSLGSEYLPSRTMRCCFHIKSIFSTGRRALITLQERRVLSSTVA
jgi:hypothetical protein